MELKNKLIILLTITLLFLSTKATELKVFDVMDNQNSFKITKENYTSTTSTNILNETLKGKKLFTEKLQKYCEMSGGRFALTYSQDEWEEIAEAGRFNETTLEICPKLKNRYQAQWTPTLYQFAYMYAKDSGNVPSS
jgi:hypothetical protein